MERIVLYILSFLLITVMLVAFLPSDAAGRVMEYVMAILPFIYLPHITLAERVTECVLVLLMISLVPAVIRAWRGNGNTRKVKR